MKTLQTFLVDEPKAIVLTIHGSGEHIGRYRHVAEWLNRQQISMVGGDLPGLGTSTEKRGHIENFNDYLHKVEEWLDFAKENWPDKPIFILGHSLGGLIVLRFLEELKDKSRLSGAIVSSPAVSIGIEVPKWQITLAKMLEKISPTFGMKSGIQPEQVSRDQLVVKRYAEDPLVYSKVSIRWFFEFQAAIEKVWQKINNLRGIDLLYLQAGADQLVKPAKAEEFVAMAENKQIEFHLIPNLYHEIFNEPEKEIYLKLMSDWILNKIRV